MRFCVIQENPCLQDVTSDLKRVDGQMEKLESASSKLWNLLSDTSAFLQFSWKVRALALLPFSDN